MGKEAYLETVDMGKEACLREHLYPLAPLCLNLLLLLVPPSLPPSPCLIKHSTCSCNPPRDDGEVDRIVVFHESIRLKQRPVALTPIADENLLSLSTSPCGYEA